MEWRVTIELNGADGTRQVHEVARGGSTDPHSPLESPSIALRRPPIAIRSPSERPGVLTFGLSASGKRQCILPRLADLAPERTFGMSLTERQVSQLELETA